MVNTVLSSIKGTGKVVEAALGMLTLEDDDQHDRRSRNDQHN